MTSCERLPLTADLLVEYLSPLTRRFGEDVAQSLMERLLVRLKQGTEPRFESCDALWHYLLRASKHLRWKARKASGRGVTLAAAPLAVQPPEQLRRLLAREQLAELTPALIQYGVNGGPASNTLRTQRRRIRLRLGHDPGSPPS